MSGSSKAQIYRVSLGRARGDPSPPNLFIVQKDTDDTSEAAIGAAVANAGLEGICVEPDEHDLIRRHQRSQLTREEFLAAARALAQAKANPDHV